MAGRAHRRLLTGVAVGAALVGAVPATTSSADPAAAPEPAAATVPGSDPGLPDDGWPDLSTFIDQSYGFAPLIIPITEPAIGYGVAGGLAFIDKPEREAQAGFGRPNISALGGLGTENGTWGVMGGDLRHWLDDRLQTLAAVFFGSVNLDYYGLGDDSLLQDDPLRYTLEPSAGLVQARYRLGASRFWGGVSYVWAATQVSFDAPLDTPGLPEHQSDSRVGGLTPSLTYDSRDNLFTPVRGAYGEVSAGLYGGALGGDDDFQRVGLIAMQYAPLHPRLSVGARGDVSGSFGDAPFYMRPFVLMRGVPVMRYQGEHVAQTEAEIRWQCWKRFSLVAFGGVGATWMQTEHLDKSVTVTAGGTGFRYELARKYGLHMGLDVAFGPDDPAIYVTFGNAWLRP